MSKFLEFFRFKKCKVAILVILIIVSIIIVYFGILFFLFRKSGVRMSQRDFMNKHIFSLKIFGPDCCSMWPVSHLILFFGLGIAFPQCHLIFLIGGILWEMFEVVAGEAQKTIEGRHIRRKITGVEYSVWWTASTKDIIFNVVGLYSGVGLRYLINWIITKAKEKRKKKEEEEKRKKEEEERRKMLA